MSNSRDEAQLKRAELEANSARLRAENIMLSAEYNSDLSDQFHGEDKDEILQHLIELEEFKYKRKQKKSVLKFLQNIFQDWLSIKTIQNAAVRFKKDDLKNLATRWHSQNNVPQAQFVNDINRRRHNLNSHEHEKHGKHEHKDMHDKPGHHDKTNALKTAELTREAAAQHKGHGEVKGSEKVLQNEAIKNTSAEAIMARAESALRHTAGHKAGQLSQEIMVSKVVAGEFSKQATGVEAINKEQIKTNQDLSKLAAKINNNANFKTEVDHIDKVESKNSSKIDPPQTKITQADNFVSNTRDRVGIQQSNVNIQTDLMQNRVAVRPENDFKLSNTSLNNQQNVRTASNIVGQSESNPSNQLANNINVENKPLIAEDGKPLAVIKSSTLAVSTQSALSVTEPLSTNINNGGKMTHSELYQEQSNTAANFVTSGNDLAAQPPNIKTAIKTELVTPKSTVTNLSDNFSDHSDGASLGTNPIMSPNNFNNNFSNSPAPVDIESTKGKLNDSSLNAAVDVAAMLRDKNIQYSEGSGQPSIYNKNIDTEVGLG